MIALAPHTPEPRVRLTLSDGSHLVLSIDVYAALAEEVVAGLPAVLIEGEPIGPTRPHCRGVGTMLGPFASDTAAMDAAEEAA